MSADVCRSVRSSVALDPTRKFSGQKVKGQGRKVTWSAWQLLADMSRTKRPSNTKIRWKVSHPSDNNFQVKGQGHQVD